MPLTWKLPIIALLAALLSATSAGIAVTSEISETNSNQLAADNASLVQTGQDYAESEVDSENGVAAPICSNFGANANCDPGISLNRPHSGADVKGTVVISPAYGVVKNFGL